MVLTVQHHRQTDTYLCAMRGRRPKGHTAGLRNHAAYVDSNSGPLEGARTQRSYGVFELTVYVGATFDGDDLGEAAQGTARAGTNGPVHVESHGHEGHAGRRFGFVLKISCILYARIITA